MAAAVVPPLLVLLLSGAQHATAVPAFLAAAGCGVVTALAWRPSLANLHLTSLEGALDRLDAWELAPRC